MTISIAAKKTAVPDQGEGTAREVFAVALRLGLTSFGGPVAHLGYFENEYVKRRRWVSAETFADLVALSQSLPGAGSSKLGIAIGMIRGGFRGGLAAWAGFTLPSALVMTLFAVGARGVSPNAGWLHGLQLVAIAVVALAVWSMATRLATGLVPGSIAILAAVAELLLPSQVTTVAIIAVAGVAGFLLWSGDRSGAAVERPANPRRLPREVVVAAAVFFALLAGLPLLRHLVGGHALTLLDGTYRSGALVFGGGTVVLPLLRNEVVGPGLVSPAQFLAGYGAAQAMPGPLFTFAAYLGGVAGGFGGAAIALAGIFLPSFLIVVATLPSLGAVRTRPGFRAALRGVNAAVVGIILAALYDPLWTGTVHGGGDFALVLAAFGLLAVARLPAWLVVILAAGGGALAS